jgi:hypothetical protein
MLGQLSIPERYSANFESRTPVHGRPKALNSTYYTHLPLCSDTSLKAVQIVNFGKPITTPSLWGQVLPTRNRRSLPRRGVALERFHICHNTAIK